MLSLAGCGKPQAPRSDPNDPVSPLLGTYAISCEGASGDGAYYVDIRRGETLLYAIQRGGHSNLEPVDSFDAETGTATASFTVYIGEEEIGVCAELTFMPGSDGVTCRGSCVAVYADGTEKRFALNGEKLWDIGEQPGI